MNKLIVSIIIFSISIAVARAQLPQKVVLPVPFTCQAPYGNWNQPYQDACEEGAVIMAMRKTLTKAQAKAEILELVEFHNKHYGDYRSTNAEQTAQLIRDFYKFENLFVTTEVSVIKIKSELAKGNIILAPMAGKMLNNPYYSRPNPDYHMLLIKGYDDSTQEFITNDDGTRRGENYRYKYSTIINAIHDWTGNNKTIVNGDKKIIIVKSRIFTHSTI